MFVYYNVVIRNTTHDNNKQYNCSYAQVLAIICIIVNFQLRNAGLTERSLYNRFCIERSTKMEFLGDFGGSG